MIDIDSEVYRKVLRRFATGVAVVTTWDGEHPWGTTVNTFTSVSLRPPLVLVAFDHDRRIVPALRATGRYAVNILGEDQQGMSDCFAGGPGKFHSAIRSRGELCGAPWRRGATGMPILAGAIAALECTVVDAHPAGDHDLYIARVDSVESSDATAALVSAAWPAYGAPAGDIARGTSGSSADTDPMPLLYYSGRYLRIERATSHDLEGKPEH